MLKEIPFDVEIAKKVVSGEIKGRITADNYPVIIYDWEVYYSCEPQIVGKIPYWYHTDFIRYWTLDGKSADKAGLIEDLKLEIEQSNE